MTSNCLTCGQEFTWNRPSVPQECCSISCAVHKPGRPKSGPKPKSTATLACDYCGSYFEARASQLRKDRAFCSRRCAGRTRYARGGLHLRKSDGRLVVALRNGSNQIYARALMEGHLGRDLQAGETVHHINEDKTDDRIENLTIMSPAEHARLHSTKRWAARKALGRS